MSPEDARRALLEPCTPEGAPLDQLRQIGEVLATTPQTSGAPGDAPAGALLRLMLTRTWPSTIDSRPFDGQTFYPALPITQLSEPAGAILRELLSSSRNVAVNARIRHALWLRFRDQGDARSAVEAYGAQVRLIDASEAWIDILVLIGHAIGLGLELNDASLLENVFAEADCAATRMLSGGRPFAFVRLADTVEALLLRKQKTRALFTEDRLERWLLALAYMPGSSGIGGPSEALRVIEVILKHMRRKEELSEVRRAMVLDLLRGGIGPGLWSAHRYEKAARLAALHGFTDLSQQALLAHSKATEESIGQMAPIHFTASLSPTLIQLVKDILEVSENAAEAIRAVAFSALLQLPVEQLKNSADENLESLVFWRISNHVRYRDNKVAFQARDRDSQHRVQVGMLADLCLAQIEATLSYLLEELGDSIEPMTLLGALADWPYLRPAQRGLLERSSERFAARDFVSSGVIIAVTYEALLRELLRAAGYPAIRLGADGAQLDETLSPLLAQRQVVEALGRDHVWLVEYVMSRADLGPNLRHEIAHGNVDSSHLTRTRVLLMWLFAIRLTLLQPGPSTRRPVDE